MPTAGTTRGTLVAAGVLVVAAATGCNETVRADRDALPADLAVAVEGIGLQPEGGVPAEIRVTVRNQSGQTVAFVVPRPLVALEPEAKTPADEPVPLPLLALVLEDADGHDESPVWTDPKARVWPKARRVALGPGGGWSASYPIQEFYFWGPCGPDAGGGFARYFWRGERPVALRAVLVFGDSVAVRSPPMRLTCRFEDWLFRERHDALKG